MFNSLGPHFKCGQRILLNFISLLQLSFVDAKLLTLKLIYENSSIDARHLAIFFIRQFVSLLSYYTHSGNLGMSIAHDFYPSLTFVKNKLDISVAIFFFAVSTKHLCVCQFVFGTVYYPIVCAVDPQFSLLLNITILHHR